ncbi:hypothetical protein BDP27DRAFT_1400199 [Rhodocollybia butyracea]|uniref:Uncharacterized protein n=1 Tax=Rhodocollybia butyracea TaxID=206335 RepID=A0A9P5Q184_9AGAR|nr:hypothetical protein BDP27DRAFT_1400199 [Rhodocollybia butyracea]
MASALSYSLFFMMPVLSLVCLSKCELTRQGLGSIATLIVLGLLGIVEGVLGILKLGNGLAISDATLEAFSELTTIAILISSIHKISKHREGSVIPGVNLVLYAVLNSLLVLAGTVLSLVPGRRSASSLLGPLFHLLFDTAVLPLLVYTFLATPSSSELDDFPRSVEDVPTPATRGKHTHLTLPLSPSFLSLSSSPPSPSSHRTFASSGYPYPQSTPTETQKCASLDLPHVRLNSTRANIVFGAKKSNGRPATSPISSQETKTRPRPAPLDLSRLHSQTATGHGSASLREHSNHPQRQPSMISKKSPVGAWMSSTRRILSLLLVAQVAALLTQGLKICIKVVENGPDGGLVAKPVSVAVVEILINLFTVAHLGCVTGALMTYRHLSSVCFVREMPTPFSFAVDRSAIPFPSYQTHSFDSPVPFTASTFRTDSFPTSVLLPEFRRKTNWEFEDFTPDPFGIVEANRETDLDALDLAFPLGPVSVGPSPSLLQKEAVVPARASSSLPASSQRASRRTNSDNFSEPSGPDQQTRAYPLRLNGSSLGSPQSSPVRKANQSQSTVTFPTPTSVPKEDVQGGDREKFVPAQIIQAQHSRSSRESNQSFGGQSAKGSRHGRLPSFPSLSSISSAAKSRSRLRSISLTGKGTRRSLSTKSGSIVDGGLSLERNQKKESRNLSTGSLSRSSSFCSPRPKRRPLSGVEGETGHNDGLTGLQRNEVSPEEDVMNQVEVDVFSVEYHSPRARRPDPLSLDQRALSPLPFSSYFPEHRVEDQYHTASGLDPRRGLSPPPLRPPRLSTFHIFPNFDALAGLGSLGVKLSRGLSSGQLPTPPRMSSLGTGRTGTRSPTSRRKVEGVGTTGIARSPSRVGIDLLRMDPLCMDKEDVNGQSSKDRKLVKDYGGWRCVDADESGQPFTANVELSELRTPPKSRQVKEDPRWGHSRIPKSVQSTGLGTPTSPSDTSLDTETTPASNLQTPRTPFTPTTPISPLRKLTRSPPVFEIDSSPYNPILSSRPLSAHRLATPPSPSSIFNSSGFRRNRFGGLAEVFNDDPDPFAAPGLGAVMRESQVSLLREDSHQRHGQAQTATRMSAWGNLTLPVPKEKRNPGIGLRRAVSRISARGSLCQEETSQDLLRSQARDAAYVHGSGEHLGRHGSISLVPVEEALLAQRLLRKLNRRAKDRDEKLKPGPGTGTTGEKQAPENANENGMEVEISASPAGGGRSFLLGMARGKFLGYGWSS